MRKMPNCIFYMQTFTYSGFVSSNTMTNVEMLYNAEIRLPSNFLDKYCKGYTQKAAEKIITHDHIVSYGSALGWWCKDM